MLDFPFLQEVVFFFFKFNYMGGNWLNFLRTTAGYLADKRNSFNNQRHGQKHWSEFPELQRIVFILNKFFFFFF